MAQLSRPYQIVLGLAAVFAAVWFVALRGHHESASTPATPSTPAANASPASAAQSPATPTKVYHGPAPGVEGLTRDVRKAHEAVGQSQQNAQQLENKSAQASNEAPPSKTQSGPSTAASAPSKVSTHAPASKNSSGSKTSSSSKPSASSVSPQLQALEKELSQHKVVLLYFWNPKSADDVAVHQQLHTVAQALKGKVAIQYALANQVGAFGSVTRSVQVYQTPTILIINEHKRVDTLTGLYDAFGIEQAISEAKQEASKA